MIHRNLEKHKADSFGFRSRIAPATLVALLLIVLMAGIAYANPETINTFTITPAAAPIGTNVTFAGNYDVTGNQNVFCFYFATADTAAWADNFTSLGSVANVSYTLRAPSDCPTVANYGSILFWTEDTTNAVFGDFFSQSVTVPAIATGSKIAAVRQYEGSDCSSGNVGSGTCNLVNFRSTSLDVLPPAATVYAGSTGTCGGNVPCFNSIQAAVDAVAENGTVNLSGSFNESPTISKSVIIQSSSNAVVAGTIAATASNVTLRGLTLNGGAGPAISGDAVTAYANNISNNSGPVVSGSSSFSHNWWGSYTVQPDGVNLDDWNKRLGAAVEGYGMGSLGLASITGGTGTAVVISHGRGSLNAPFGQATVEDGNTQCSDYYDFFVLSASGTWTVNVPIDNGNGCDVVYNSRTVFRFDFSSSCMAGPNPDPDPACWNSILANGGLVTQVSSGANRWLRWGNVPASALQGTPIVGGNQENLDPTAVSLQNFGLQPGTTTLPLLALGLALLAGATIFVVRRRQV